MRVGELTLAIPPGFGRDLARPCGKACASRALLFHHNLENVPSPELRAANWKRQTRVFLRRNAQRLSLDANDVAPVARITSFVLQQPALVSMLRRSMVRGTDSAAGWVRR